MDLILRNARRIGAEHELTDIGIAGGRIAAIQPGLAAEGESIDLGGRLVSPGFVETHPSRQIVHPRPLQVRARRSRRGDRGGGQGQGGVHPGGRSFPRRAHAREGNPARHDTHAHAS